VNARGRRPARAGVKRILSGSVLQLQHKEAAKQCLMSTLPLLASRASPSDTPAPSAGQFVCLVCRQFTVPVTRFVPVTICAAAHQGNGDFLPSALSCMSGA